MKTRWWHLLRTLSTEAARGRLTQLSDDELKSVVVGTQEDLARFEVCVTQLHLLQGAVKAEEARRR